MKRSFSIAKAELKIFDLAKLRTLARGGVFPKFSGIRGSKASDKPE